MVGRLVGVVSSLVGWLVCCFVGVVVLLVVSLVW